MNKTPINLWLLSGLWGVLSSAMGYSVTTPKGAVVFLLGEALLLLIWMRGKL